MIFCKSAAHFLGLSWRIAMLLLNRLLLITALLTCIVATASTARAQRAADTAIERRFFDLTRAKSSRAALRLADSLVRVDERWARAHLLRGYAHQLLENWDEAESSFREAMRLDPQDMDAYNAAGLLAYSMQRFEESEQYYTLGLSRIRADDTMYFFMINNRGTSHLMRRQWDAAYADFSHALKQRPNDVPLLTNAATALLESGRAKEGMDILLRLYNQDSTNINVVGNLAYRFGEMGKYTEAVRFGNRVLALADPEDEVALGLAYSNRSYARTQSGDPRGGLEDAEKGIRYYPGNSYVYRNKALALLALRRKREACEALEFAARQGFATSYGAEVDELREKHCEGRR